MGERRAALAALNGGDGADDDRVGVALEDLFDPAVDRRQRVGEQRRAGGERRPAADGEARRAALADAAGEAVGEFAVARAEQIDGEGAGLAQPLSVCASRLRQTSKVGGDSDSDVNAVTVQPERPSPAPQATIATPAANSRIA